MFRNRRFACLFLGMWLGVSASVDLLVSRNSSTVDSFIASPGDVTVSSQIKQAGQKSVRLILHRNASEENAWILEIWEWCQIGIAILFFFLILFGERPPTSALVLVPVMLVIILLERFLLTPHVAALASEVDEMPAMGLVGNPTVAQFRAFQAFYAGCEILKMLLGLGVGARLMIRRTPEHLQREPEWETAAAGNSAHRASSERRTGKRRKTDQNG